MGGCASNTTAFASADHTDGHHGHMDLSHFEMIRVVGKGGFGKVSAAKRLKDNEIVAVKRIEKFALLQSDAYLRAAWRERQVMPLVSGYPFLCPLYHAFHTDAELFLVMPFYGGGDLRYFLKEKGIMNEDTARFYAAQMLIGMEMLHHKNIIYRDMKPDNLLLDAEGNIVISDFGLAYVLSENNNFKAFSNAGTSGYKGPEVLQCLEYDYSADFWSFGVCLYELLHGYLPYTRKGQWLHTVAISAQVDPMPAKNSHDGDASHGEMIEPPDTQYEGGPDEVHISRRLSNEARSLLRSLLILQRARRLGSGFGNRGVELIKAHPWFRGVDWAKMAKKEIPPPYVPDINRMHCSPDAQLEASSDPAPRLLPVEKQRYFSGWSYNTALHPPARAYHRPSILDTGLNFHQPDVEPAFTTDSHELARHHHVMHEPAHLPNTRPQTPTESHSGAFNTTSRPNSLNANTIHHLMSKKDMVAGVPNSSSHLPVPHPPHVPSPKIAEECNLDADQISINGHAPFKKCTSENHTLKLYPSLAGITAEVANLLGITYTSPDSDEVFTSGDLVLPEASQVPSRLSGSPMTISRPKSVHDRADI